MTEPGKQSVFRNFIVEAKRRHVFKTAALYAGGAFAVLQLADILMPTLGIDESAISNLLILIAIGFPIALIAAWLLDISADGVSVTAEISSAEKSTLSGARLTEVLMVLIAIGVGFLYLERFMLNDRLEEPLAKPANQVESAGEASPITLLEPSIAVLPFDNLSDSNENAYFAAGIHEDILNNLSKIAELIVTSRTSTLAYANSVKSISTIGNELGVNYVIEGSVRRAGTRVRISVQLIEAATDSHIWSEAYEREILDVFEVQQQIANEVSHALKIQFDVGQIAGERPTKVLEAYELFLAARELTLLWEPDNLVKAVSMYRQALALDPAYADAWAGLSLALNSGTYIGSGDNTQVEAVAAADKALLLDPESWLANYAKGWTLSSRGVGSSPEAIRYFRKAVETNPNNGELLTFYATVLWTRGRADEAIHYYSAAYRRDPFSAVANLARANIAVVNADRAAADKYIRLAIDLAPNRTYVRWWAGATYMAMLDYENGLRQMQKVLELDPNHLSAMFWTGEILTNLGDHDAAKYWLDRAHAIAPSNSEYFWRRANLYALGGDADGYIQLIDEWLEIAPDNLDAQRYQQFATRRVAWKAWDKEDFQGARQHTQAALQQGLDYLQTQNYDDGEQTLAAGSVWSVLSAATNASFLGQDALMQTLCEKVIEHHGPQPVGANRSRSLHLMLAYALLGEVDQAASYAAQMKQENYHLVWLLGTHGYGVIDDRFQLYHGLKDNLVFKDMVASLTQVNEQTIAGLRQELPELFPPEAFSSER